MIALLGPIANIATTWLEGRQEKAKAKQKLAVAKVEAQVKRVEQDGSWEEKAIDSMDSSFKDEAWTIFFILIIGASLIISGKKGGRIARWRHAIECDVEMLNSVMR